jgi:nickel transport protein
MRFTSFIATTILAGAVALPAHAHGIWFAQRARQVALIYGVGADDLDAVKRLPLVQGVTGYNANYQPIGAKLRVAGPILLVDADEQPTLLAAVLDNGVWSRIGEGEFEKKGRDEMPNATLSERTMKYAVSIQGPLDKPIPALPDQLLQIVPVGKIPEKLGTKLTYKVLHAGKPVKGARVINDMVNDPDAKEVRTAADGTVTLPVRNQGLNVIRAVYNAPTDNPAKYDHIEETATLAFTLAHKPE